MKLVLVTLTTLVVMAAPALACCPAVHNSFSAKPPVGGFVVFAHHSPQHGHDLGQAKRRED